jgi:anti-anti-sigma regulatory factor
MVNQTLADGFTGLRVAGENGWILSDPRYRDAWIPYEVRVDRMISGLPLVGMCSFDIRECDDDAMQVMDAVHPVRVGAGSTTSSFHLHSHRDGRIAVQGELDYTMSDTVRSLLAALAEDGAAPEVDLAELTFSDVRGISAIASGVREFAATGSPVRLQGAPSTFRRIWGLLELDRVAPVEFVASRAAVG